VYPLGCTKREGEQHFCRKKVTMSGARGKRRNGVDSGTASEKTGGREGFGGKKGTRKNTKERGSRGKLEGGVRFFLGEGLCLFSGRWLT